MGAPPQLSILMGEQRDRGARETALHRQFEQNLQLSQCGDDHALTYSDGTCEVRLTYAELNERASCVARAIVEAASQAQRNPDGDFIVAICMKPSHCTVVTMLGAWKAGAAYLPLEPIIPQASIANRIADAKPALLIYDETAQPSMFASCEVMAISYDELFERAANQPTGNLQPEEGLEQTEDHTAIVLYTSGSTGSPLGVRLPHAAISNRIWWQFNRFPFATDERRCTWKTALTFLDSMCEIWAPLLSGRELIVLPQEIVRNPQRLIAELDKREIQRLVLVPTLLRSILMYLSLNPLERPLPKLKLWVCSGETLTKDLAGQFFEYFDDDRGYRLANFYGSTELTADVTYHVMESSANVDQFKSVPIGTPLDNCIIYLMDPELKPVKEGQTGELWVSGDNLASGYVGGQGWEKFCTNPLSTQPGYNRLFCTGDFGLIEKGTLLYAGRVDSQIKIRGHRIDLQEVDSALSSIRGIEKWVVLCYGVNSSSPALLAFVTLHNDAKMSAATVETILNSKMARFMVPQVIEVDKIPLLVSGKVDRQTLLKLYEKYNRTEFIYDGVKPDEMEKAKVLFTTVGDVIGRSLRGAITINSNFYELGGDSLNTIYTITQLAEKGYFIDIGDFLNSRNMGELLFLLNKEIRAGKKDETGFTDEPLADHHKLDIIAMVTYSFYEKAGCQIVWLKQGIRPEDYSLYVCGYWDALLRAGLSTVLRNSSGASVAVALNFDARLKPDIKLQGGLGKIMQLLESIEIPLLDTMLPKGEGAILHSFMMATAASLSPRDNVAAIRALEHATLRIARERNFKSVFTTNTSPLTQQLGRDVLGYQTLVDYQVNQYVDPSGERTFVHAPDDQRALICWKPVD